MWNIVEQKQNENWRHVVWNIVYVRHGTPIHTAGATGTVG